MVCSLEELRAKEVIDIQTGEKLGYIDDIRMDISSSEVLSLVIYGGYRFFGLFGKENDTEIPCDSVKVIGSETILVENISLICTKRKFRGFKSLFG